jgi:hypothetical protein
MFHAVWVRDGRGSGLDPEGNPDQIIFYNGRQVTVSQH